MTTWLVVLGAAACTYLLRISMVVAFAGRSIPAGLEARMRLVGPAVLAAVVTGSLFTTEGSVDGPPAGQLAAVAAAAIVVHRTGKPAHALLVGLPVAWLAIGLGAG